MTDAFRTKTGRCKLADGVVRFERRPGGALGTLREAVTAEDVPVERRAAVALGVAALVAGAVLAVRVLPAWALGVVVGLLAAWGAWRYRASRTAGPDDDEVALEDVVAVEAHAGGALLTRPGFVFRYRDEGGVKHRWVPCPSRVYGFDAFERGRRLFEEHGLLVGDRPAPARERPA